MTNSDQVYKFILGEYNCYVIRDAERPSTLGESFPAIDPVELTAAREKLGYSEELEVGMNLLLVDTGSQKILVDAGLGNARLISNLESLGITPQDIDFLVVTHGDGDHIGGIRGEDDKDVFSNTKFIILKEAWDLWTTEEGRQVMIEDFMPIARSRGMTEDQIEKLAENRASYGLKTLPLIKDRIEVLESEAEFLPGFRIIAAPGHRSDHAAVEITSGEDTLLHFADSFRHPIQVSYPHFYSNIDTFPEQIAATNRKLFERAAVKNSIVFASHMTFPALGRIENEGEAWIWKDV